MKTKNESGDRRAAVRCGFLASLGMTTEGAPWSMPRFVPFGTRASIACGTRAPRNRPALTCHPEERSDEGSRRHDAGATHLVRTFLLATLFATTLAQAEPAPPPEPTLQPLSAVLPDLRRGGYVIYMRHGVTDTTRGDAEGGDLARCETQRNLSELGRAQEAAAGRGIKALRIPIGQVLTSPFCRCKDTATLAFGHYDVVPDLHFAMGASTDDRQRLSAALRERLGTVPPAGTNTVIVSHTANLREAAGIWPKPEGVAFIFKPLGNGRFEPVAKALPDEWAALAATARP